jgi:hypothetical protein
MSLNKILFQGKVDEGLDLVCKSVTANVLSTGDMLVNQNLTVVGLSQLQSQVIMQGSASVQGNLSCFSKVITPELELAGKQVILDGVFPEASQGFLPQNGHLSNATTRDQTFQFYGNSLHIQGNFVAELASPVLSRYATVTINMPPGYSMLGNIIGKTLSASGSGGELAVLNDTQPMVLGYTQPASTTSYTMVWYTGDGAGPRLVGNQMVFSYNIRIDNVAKV